MGIHYDLKTQRVSADTAAEMREFLQLANGGGAAAALFPPRFAADAVSDESDEEERDDDEETPYARVWYRLTPSVRRALLRLADRRRLTSHEMAMAAGYRHTRGLQNLGRNLARAAEAADLPAKGLAWSQKANWFMDQDFQAWILSSGAALLEAPTARRG